MLETYQSMKFSKYQGTGNDFIMVDNFSKATVCLAQNDIEKLCDRHFGIGADGLIIISKSEKFDFKMTYYNSDGGEGSMCGNGGRCAVAFAFQKEIVKKKDVVFEAFDGIHKAKISSETENEFLIELGMKDVVVEDINDNRLIVDTGSPHYVTHFDENLMKSNDINKKGAEIRYDKNISKDGVNVDFVYFDGTKAFVRTYERGVENETLSCGTGATASAIAISMWYGLNEVDLFTLGGSLSVSFCRNENHFKEIILKGLAKEVFRGEINLLKNQ